jgi:hypothetical protein
MRSLTILTGFLVLWLAWPAAAQQGGRRPAAEIVLVPGEASAVPTKQGVAYANGGVIDVAQPNPTTVVMTHERANGHQLPGDHQARPGIQVPR